MSFDRTRLLQKRYRKERMFRLGGLSAVLFAVLCLCVLMGNVLVEGASALRQSYVWLEVPLPKERFVGADGLITPASLRSAPYKTLLREQLQQHFPKVEGIAELRRLSGLLSLGAARQLREEVMDDPARVGTTVKGWFLVSDQVDLLVKGRTDANLPESERGITDREVEWVRELQNQGLLERRFNWLFFTGADSREPEQAGMLGGLVGSLMLMFVAVAVAFPMGVMAAIYLEEFAPQNRFTDIIEVNINNLAAVPSIIFGLLGLVVYLQFFEMPRSSALVGGMTLALMTLPTIIITTRVALRAVPASIRDAARGLGASPLQVVLHHALPLAMPGIMTGTILGLARAIGETAPLLMIGMVAFVADVPGGLTDPAVALPVQIYNWADSPEIAYQERTSLAIVVLLLVLACMNGLAVVIRRRFERRW